MTALFPNFTRLAAVAILLLSAVPAVGQSYLIWDGGTDTNWLMGSNWRHGAAPTGSSEVHMRGSGGTLSNAYSGAPNQHRLFFDAGAGAYTLNGPALVRFGSFSGYGPLIQNNTGAGQSLNFAVAVDGRAGGNFAEINAWSGNLALNSTLDLEWVTALQIFVGSGKQLTFDGVISSTGNGGNNTCTINGSGQVNFNAGNTYGGGTILNGGLVVLNGANDGLSSVGPGTLRINSGATVRAGSHNPLGQAAGAALSPLVINGGTFEATEYCHSNSITMTGGTIAVRAGITQVDGLNMRLRNAANPSLTTLAAASSSTISSRILLEAPTTVSVADGAAADDLIVSGRIHGGSLLTKTGSGTLRLNTVENLHTGGTVMNGGVIKAEAPGSPYGSLGSGNVTVNSGRIIASGDHNTLVGYDTTVAPARTLTINAGASVESTGTLTCHLFHVRLNGGELVAALPNTTFANWNLDLGVSVPADAPLSTIRGGNLVASQIGGTVFDVEANSTLVVDSVFEPFSFNNVSDTGIIKNGTGTLRLLKSNNHTSTATLNAGTLEITNSQGLGGGGAIVFAGGRLFMNGVGPDISSRISAIASGEMLDLSTSGGSPTFASAISGAGGVKYSGAAADVLTLTAAPTFTGPLQVTGSTLRMNDSRAAVFPSITLNSAKLHLAFSGSITTTTFTVDGNQLVAGTYKAVGSAAVGIENAAIIGTGTLIVQQSPPGAAPSGADKTITVSAGGTYVFNDADWSFADAGDSPPHNFMAMRISTLPVGGTLKADGVAVAENQPISRVGGSAPVITYTAPLTAGPQSFTFQVQDDSGGNSIDLSPNTMTLNVVPHQEIEVLGNSQNIVLGDTTPALADHTDFGNVAVVGGMLIRTFTVINSGGYPLTLGTVSTSSADFIVAAQPAATVAVGGSTTFQITFDASVLGLRNGTVTVPNDDIDTNPFTFAIQGTGIAPEIAVMGIGQGIAIGDDTPDVADHTNFGGGNVTRTFTVTNSGDDTLNLSAVTLTGPHLADFSVVAQPAASVAVGNSTTFQITFTPSAAGWRFASVNLPNNDPDERPFTFAIVGIGPNSAPAGTDKGVSMVPSAVYSITDADWGFTDANDTPANIFREVKLTTLPTAGTLQVNGINATAGQIVSLGQPTGAVWTARDFIGNWSCLASSADGVKLVAARAGGRIYTSTDSGVTWTARESNRDWRSVASSADGTKLVAACYLGQLHTSTDSGVTWTARAHNNIWNIVTSSADGTKLAATTEFGFLYASSDSGVTWTIPQIRNETWRGLASSADGTKLVAVNYNTGSLITSANSGVTWTHRDVTRKWNTVASSADGTKLVAGELGGYLLTSTDSGMSWTLREEIRHWVSVTSSADGTKLAAIAANGQIYVSANSGITWTPRETNRPWRALAISGNGSKLVAAASGGQIYTSAEVLPPSISYTAPAAIGPQSFTFQVQDDGFVNQLDLSAKTLTFDIVTADYTTWATANGLTGGPNNDDDHDGQTNRDEYAFGLDPNNGNSVSPLQSISPTTFRYTRRSLLLTGLTYTVRTSTDLTTWTPVGVTETIVSTANGVETVEAILPFSTGFLGRGFVKVEAE